MSRTRLEPPLHFHKPCRTLYCRVRSGFDGQINQIPGQQNEMGDVFPWRASEGRAEGSKKEFLVPCHKDLHKDTAWATVVSLFGLASEPSSSGSHLVLAHAYCMRANVAGMLLRLTNIFRVGVCGSHQQHAAIAALSKLLSKVVEGLIISQAA